MLVTVKNLKVEYGRQTALNIDRPIVINEGERIGVIGANGAGKTTFVKSLLGLVKYKGNVRTALKPEQMAVHMQFNNYTSTMPVRLIMETILDTKIKENEELKALIDYFEFEGCLRKRYPHLSGGQKQRMTIIMVMLQNAPLTFYDEVTSGLDFETRQKLMIKLSDWYRDKDNALCIVSHYYEELEMLADKLLLLSEGRAIDFGDKEELFEKYCGKSVIIIDNTDKNLTLVKNLPRLHAPDHLIALSCKDIDAERRITELLLRADVNFKRSGSDIEIMSINAIKTFEKKGGNEDEA